MDIAYPPVLQSGGEYDLRLAAAASKDTHIHYGVIVCSLGARCAAAGAHVPESWVCWAAGVRGAAEPRQPGEAPTAGLPLPAASHRSSRLPCPLHTPPPASAPTGDPHLTPPIHPPAPLQLRLVLRQRGAHLPGGPLQGAGGRVRGGAGGAGRRGGSPGGGRPHERRLRRRGGHAAGAQRCACTAGLPVWLLAAASLRQAGA